MRERAPRRYVPNMVVVQYVPVQPVSASMSERGNVTADRDEERSDAERSVHDGMEAMGQEKGSGTPAGSWRENRQAVVDEMDREMMDWGKRSAG